MTSRRLVTSTVLVVAFVWSASGDPPARAAGDAEIAHSIDAQLFKSAIGSRNYLTLDGAQVARHKQFALGLVGNYQREPFVLKALNVATGAETTTAVVDHQLTTELVGAIGLQDKFQLGLALPVTPVMKGEDFNAQGMPTGSKIEGGGLGDIRVEGKWHVADFGPSEEFAFAAIGGLTVPVGNRDKFLGDRNVTGLLRGVLEWKLDDVRVGGSLGFNFRQPSKNFAAKVGQQLTYALGVDYRVHRDVSLIGELFGRSGLEDFFKRYADANPAELDLGVRVALPAQVYATFGGGAGVVKGIGAPLFRGFLGLGWAPDFSDRDGDGIYDVEDRCPDDAEDKDDFKDSDGCPEADNDGDGLLDRQDKCPDEAEDFDQFQDDDGCPEVDNDKDGLDDLKDPCPNAAEDGRGKRPKDGCPSTTEDGDGDGVPDAKDKCPDDPEDRDGFQDYDGCPEPDNDNDSIPDQFDGCPNDAEDADGFEDEDGCPDPDNDKDGFPDASDKCPKEPETLNGNKDDDGCPDAGAEIVRVTDQKIESRERIGFAGSNLSSSGNLIVGLVALAMKGHTEIALLRVEVYADGMSKADTQARANTIVKALVAKGVAESRLKAVGMGGGNKVELLIEQKADPNQKKAPAGDK